MQGIPMVATLTQGIPTEEISTAGTRMPEISTEEISTDESSTVATRMPEISTEETSTVATRMVETSMEEISTVATRMPETQTPATRMQTPKAQIFTRVSLWSVPVFIHRQELRQIPQPTP